MISRLLLFVLLLSAFPAILAAESVDNAFQFATSLYESTRYEEAIIKLDGLLSLDPENVDAWALLGVTHRDNWNKAEAMTALKQALRLDKNHVSSRRYLGELYIMLGSTSKAKKQLNKLKKICLDCDETFQLTLMIQNAESGYCRFLPSNRVSSLGSITSHSSAKSKEQRAKSKEQRAKSKEQRAKSKEQILASKISLRKIRNLGRFVAKDIALPNRNF